MSLKIDILANLNCNNKDNTIELNNELTAKSNSSLITIYTKPEYYLLDKNQYNFISNESFKLDLDNNSNNNEFGIGKKKKYQEPTNKNILNYNKLSNDEIQILINKEKNILSNNESNLKPNSINESINKWIIVCQTAINEIINIMPYDNNHKKNTIKSVLDVFQIDYNIVKYNEDNECFDE